MIQYSMPEPNDHFIVVNSFKFVLKIVNKCAKFVFNGLLNEPKYK